MHSPNLTSVAQPDIEMTFYPCKSRPAGCQEQKNIHNVLVEGLSFTPAIFSSTMSLRDLVEGTMPGVRFAHVVRLAAEADNVPSTLTVLSSQTVVGAIPLLAGVARRLNTPKE